MEAIRNRSPVTEDPARAGEFGWSPEVTASAHMVEFQVFRLCRPWKLWFAAGAS